MRISFVYWGIMMEENIASTLNSMMKRNNYTGMGRRGGAEIKLAGLFLKIQRCTTYLFSRYKVGLGKKAP